MKTVMHILIAIIVLVVALSLLLVYANTHPPRYSLHIPPSDRGAAFEVVSFTTDDGLELRGWFIPPAGTVRPLPPGIILCHGQGANRSDFTDLAVALSRRGFAVLTFDFRAHGESAGRRSSLGYLEQKDIAAAYRYLAARRDVDGKRVGIFGFSLGAASTILAAARTGSFQAVVADSSFTSLREQAREAISGHYHLPSFPFLHLAVFGYELSFRTNVDAVAPERVIGRIAPAPVFVICGEGDDLIPAANGKRLYAAAREPKELWVIPVSGHGFTMAAAGGEYDRRIGEFFERSLK